MKTEATKNNTLKLRMDHVTLELLERARGYAEINKSKFIRQSIREKAESILAEREKTQFSKDDWHRFFDLIEHPSEPTERMRRAARKYAEISAPHEV